MTTHVADASESEASTPAIAFASLHDVQCPVSVILGTGVMTIRECLALRPDSVLMLAQSAGEDLMLVANGIELARGEVVVFEDGAALRVTEIVPAAAPRAV